MTSRCSRKTTQAPVARRLTKAIRLASLKSLLTSMSTPSLGPDPAATCTLLDCHHNRNHTSMISTPDARREQSSMPSRRKTQSRLWDGRAERSVRGFDVPIVMNRAGHHNLVRAAQNELHGSGLQQFPMLALSGGQGMLSGGHGMNIAEGVSGLKSIAKLTSAIASTGDSASRANAQANSAAQAKQSALKAEAVA